jgi:hypothetical protein
MVTASALLWIAGCKESSDPSNDDEYASEDAATTIASAMSEEDGGAIDQMGDASQLATQAGTLSQAAEGTELVIGAGVKDSVSRTFNSSDTSWTVYVQRTRTSAFGLNTASFYRRYQFQFRNKNDVAQQNYITGSDTAYSMIFKLLEGTGVRKVAFRSTHRLTSLSGLWILTGTNTSVVTMNGSSNRAGSGTLRTRDAERTLNYTLSLNFIDCKTLRGNRTSISDSASGTVSGVYNATVSFSRGDLYKEKTIHREFTVAFTGGMSHIQMGGRTFKFRMRDGI